MWPSPWNRWCCYADSVHVVEVYFVAHLICIAIPTVATFYAQIIHIVFGHRFRMTFSSCKAEALNKYNYVTTFGCYKLLRKLLLQPVKMQIMVCVTKLNAKGIHLYSVAFNQHHISCVCVAVLGATTIVVPLACIL